MPKYPVGTKLNHKHNKTIYVIITSYDPSKEWSYGLEWWNDKGENFVNTHWPESDIDNDLEIAGDPLEIFVMNKLKEAGYA